jgi:hypothetical protein
MASGTAPNSSNIGRVAAGVANATSVVVHPEYMYWRPDWQKLRDVIAGQREVKRMAERYLKRLPKQDNDDYDLYLARATFYNMTRQTLKGMSGQVFARDPIISELPKKFKAASKSNFGKDGSGHVAFTKTVISEVLTMGRFGVLVDAPAVPTKTPTSYAVGYTAENILDWKIEDINGTFQVTRVLLREFTRQTATGPTQDNPWLGQKAGVQPVRRENGRIVRASAEYVEAYTYSTTYRELCLEQADDGSYVYIQRIYTDDINAEPDQTFVPTVRGVPLDFIPFMFFGATGNSADVEQSPLLDIADLNLSHYRTYAELEWGRMYTALPVYYAPTRDEDGASIYSIGPSVVWEVPADAEPPGILEYKGQGLKALETALSSKEDQIAAIGGRLLPGGNKGSESPEQAKRTSLGEQALLLDAVQATGFGMTQVVRWWLMWRDVPLDQSAGIDYSLNRNFGYDGPDARVLRSLQQLHDDGKIPIQVLYEALIATEFLDPEITVDDFKLMLAEPDNFPNNPDIIARQQGFATRQQQLDQADIAREADLQARELDLEERTVVLEERATDAAEAAGTLAPPKPIQSPQPSPPLPARPAAKRPAKASGTKKPKIK